jgi:chromosome segregation ATPase
MSTINDESFIFIFHFVLKKGNKTEINMSHISDKISKLEAATDEAQAQVEVARQALHLATQQAADAKAKYKSLPQEEQETLQVTDTELPELIETHLRAKNVYDTVVARHATNQRYLNALKQKNASS